MVQKWKNGRKRCRVCKKRLPAQRRASQVVCINPDNRNIFTECQIKNRRDKTMVAREMSDKKKCRVCRKPLPEKSRSGRQYLCANPSHMKDEYGRVLLTECQIINRRKVASKARGYGKLDEVQCEICFEFFTPDHPAQKVHKSKVKGEMSACELERQRRYSKKHRGSPGKSGHHRDNEDATQEMRICLGRLCTEESTYPGELKFQSKGPFNRQCDRCKEADEPGGREVTNSDPGRLSRDTALAEV